MLTTIDNPYNPYKDFDKWREWDSRHHYNTCEYLARIVGPLNEELLESEVDERIDKAMFEIIALDPVGTYRIIEEEDKTPLDEKAYQIEMEKFVSI